MSNVLPILFIILAAIALVLTLLWLWQSVRHAFVHTLPGATSAVVSPERAALLAEKQALLVALKDLEAERDAGKLSQADFGELNEQYRKRAREVLRSLDAMLAPHREAAKSLLHGSPASAASAPGSGSHAASSAAPAAVGCTSCGASNDSDAVFCKRCGTRLRSGVSA